MAGMPGCRDAGTPLTVGGLGGGGRRRRVAESGAVDVPTRDGHESRGDSGGDEQSGGHPEHVPDGASRIGVNA
jgi:hypothetical protein